MEMVSNEQYDVTEADWINTYDLLEKPDAHMIDGESFAAWYVSAARWTAPIVVVTANGKAVRTTMLSYGPVLEVLEKPVLVERLLEVVRLATGTPLPATGTFVEPPRIAIGAPAPAAPVARRTAESA